MSVTFEVNFTNSEDQQLARVFLLELNDSKRNVQNAPGVVFHDRHFPDNVSRVFPGAMKTKTSNGSVSFVLGAPHIKKGVEQPLSQLIGFR